jgi:hypothetical protein
MINREDKGIFLCPFSCDKRLIVENSLYLKNSYLFISLIPYIMELIQEDGRV